MSHSEKRACVRCGHSRTVRPDRPTSVLCRDCQDVAAELGELPVWLAGTTAGAAA